MEGEFHDRLKRMKANLEIGAPPQADDISFLVRHCERVDTRLLEVVDLLQQSRNTFRSKQIERARKILEELI
jgi:hypothetical protein